MEDRKTEVRNQRSAVGGQRSDLPSSIIHPPSSTRYALSANAQKEMLNVGPHTLGK
jgi:hypothetical protein